MKVFRELIMSKPKKLCVYMQNLTVIMRETKHNWASFLKVSYLPIFVNIQIQKEKITWKI